MNNKEFTSELSRRIDRNAKETAALMTALVSEIAVQLGEENQINVQGFGVFDVKKKMEHITVHPSTRQKMLVPPKMEIKFKPSATIKDKLK
ncbi:MAG: HU family DNA-binding protein [Bacteroidaceae bacterium]|nr:HU family DNA-binding protein [Bacteroidaceae bacterium]